MRGDDPGHKKRKVFVFFPVFLCPPKIGRCVFGASCLDGCCFDVHCFFVDLKKRVG